MNPRECVCGHTEDEHYDRDLAAPPRLGCYYTGCECAAFEDADLEE